MRVLVCGSRDFTDKRLIWRALAQLHKVTPISVLIDGAAPGADTIAHEWARAHGVTPERYPAKWDEYGKAAGPIRNQQMLDEGRPDLVLAFSNKPLDQSRGTRDMVTRALGAGVKVMLTEPQDWD